MDIGEVLEAASDLYEGAKDVVSDVFEDVGDFLSDAGETAQETLDTLGDRVAEALENGDFKEAVEQSDLPEEAKETLQETREAFKLEISQNVKDIAKVGAGLLGSLIGFGTGHVAFGVWSGSHAVKAGVNLWQSASQVSGTSGNAQMQKMTQMG